MIHPTKHDLADVVADTLFIPLYMRCLETRRACGIIHDPAACKIVESLDYDFSRYDNKPMSQIGTSIRVRHFDGATKDFIATHQQPVIVNIGCGLDTRFHRLGSNKGIFYELDLAEVMTLREQLLPASECNPTIVTSMFDTAWMDSLSNKHPHHDWMFIAEGVLLYFPEQEVKRFIQNLAQRFPRCEFHFDVCSSWAVKNSRKHDTVKLTNADFKWGLDDDRALEQWVDGLRYQATSYYMNQEKKRWGLRGMIARGLLPARAKAFRMLHYELNLAGEE
jgi:O-methyltransferase involved in polyketide biosynthesis